jgi:hypothetical protein
LGCHLETNRGIAVSTTSLRIASLNVKMLRARKQVANADPLGVIADRIWNVQSHCTNLIAAVADSRERIFDACENLGVLKKPRDNPDKQREIPRSILILPSCLHALVELLDCIRDVSGSVALVASVCWLQQFPQRNTKGLCLCPLQQCQQSHDDPQSLRDPRIGMYAKIDLRSV